MKLSYLQKGEGKNLVLLHGYLASKESFYPQIEYFSKTYRVTALDFPGMGMADALETPWSVSDYADWTTQALAFLGIQNANLIAHSFGGRVAIKLLSRGYPFKSAALCGCAGIVPKRTLFYRIRVNTYKLIKKIAPAYAEKHFGSDDYRRLSPVMRESFKKIVNEDLREDAKKIVCPVLFISGDRDRETPVSQTQLLVSCVKGSKHTVLKGCGHFAHLDNPLAFQLAVEDFYHADN